MTILTGRFRVAVLFSCLTIIPFIAMEMLNRQTAFWDFPFVLFASLWLLSLAFVFLLIPVLQNLRASTGVSASGILLRAFGSLVIAWMWINIVRDQMPCFLGVPNCD